MYLVVSTGFYYRSSRVGEGYALLGNSQTVESAGVGRDSYRYTYDASTVVFSLVYGD